MDKQANNHRAINMTITLKHVIPHIIWDLPPPQTFNGPPSTMHKQRAAKVFGGQNTSLTQTQNCQKLEDNDLK